MYVVYSHIVSDESCNEKDKNSIVLDADTFDYIIVGGGTAGCVIAKRLVELRYAKVLLIEAGTNPPLESIYPGYFLYLKQSAVDWSFASKREFNPLYIRNGRATITQGKMLGGTSGLNFMAYARGDPIDYALWATISNDSSWSYEEILQLFKKSENMQDRDTLESQPDKDLHGTLGLVKLRKFHRDVGNKYLKALQEMGNNILINKNSRSPLGFTPVLFTCGEKFRQSTAYSFLRQVGNNLLYIMTNSTATKILFDDEDRAVGVSVLTHDNRNIRVVAEKEVILTAGVFKTPQLLMVSGIGPRKHLQSKKIKMVVDLPVGRNLQDHPVIPVLYKMGERLPLKKPINPYTIEFTAIDGSVAITKPQDYPDYSIYSLILDDPEMFLILCAVSLGYTNEVCDTMLKSVGKKQMFLVLNHLAYPKSRGEVCLQNSNIFRPPDIKLGFYTHKDDIKQHARALMHFNKILNTSYFKRVDAKIVDPKLMCGKMRPKSHTYWKCYAASMVTTLHYNVGTCAMGTVVDSKLFVKGVKNLRIADASVMPVIVSGPTVATVMMIAEKAAEMIKDDFYANKK
ncbi:ecdysone oxidase-like [Anticarsia gemmatalis]|uniref:ecdysone oxidase-like n=1 Tax=Anticarsia gemmatalis TaxID=129554 RepID=UPI003F75B835